MLSIGRTGFTGRGFFLVEFRDEYDKICSIQRSSLFNPACIWFGIDGHRMHLTQAMVAELLPYLQRFVETGELEASDGAAD